MQVLCLSSFQDFKVERAEKLPHYTCWYAYWSGHLVITCHTHVIGLMTRKPPARGLYHGPIAARPKKLYSFWNSNLVLGREVP